MNQTEKRKTLKRIALVAFAAGAVVVLLHTHGWSAPQPALVPSPGAWQLDFQIIGGPEQITVTLPGDAKPCRFWYLLYTVSNRTSREVEFLPEFELFTDTFQLYQSGVKVRRPIFEAIRQRYAGSVPLLEPEGTVSGKILLGKDNARDSVAIFQDFDPNATHVKLFVSGLSNETVIVNHPTAFDLATGNPKEVLLRKTLTLKYQVTGDVQNPQNRVLLYRNRDWIMR